MRPDLVVLAEGELWPNFLLAAQEQRRPGRGRQRPDEPAQLPPLPPARLAGASAVSRCIDLFAVQTEEYAASFRSLGVRPNAIHVTGSVKYDGVSGDRQQPEDAGAAPALFGIRRDELVWVAGSTQAPEEEIVLRHLPPSCKPSIRTCGSSSCRGRRTASTRWPSCWSASACRSFAAAQLGPDPRSAIRDRAVVLVDTIGELGALWGLADVAFVGGSLDGQRGGQNMIEPAAYGAAVVFGPHVWNFQDTVERLLAADAAMQVADAAELEVAIRRLLADALERQRLGQAARQLVQAQQGATARTIEVLSDLTKARTLPLAG